MWNSAEGSERSSRRRLGRLLASAFRVACLVASVVVAHPQNREPKGEVTFVLRFLQANQESRDTFATKREAIRGSLGQNSFERTDAMRVHLFGENSRLEEDLSSLKSRGSLEDLSTVRMRAPAGAEALWVVGGEDILPTIPVDGASAAPELREFRRDFGLRLSLVAWPLPDGRLRVRVRPTVTAVDFGQSTVRGGRFEPTLVSRRMDTYLDVKLGQSFAVTGALDTDLLAKLDRSEGVSNDRLFQAIDERHKARPGTSLVLLITPESVEAIPIEPVEKR
jgi:Flp pilus assembly secretin CpaC